MALAPGAAEDEDARRAAEAGLRRCLDRKSFPGFELLYNVSNTDAAPSNVYRVTLAHIYDALGRSLGTWADWPRFVDRLGPRLLRTASLSRTELTADPRRPSDLCRRIAALQEERLWTKTTRGEQDVVEPAEKVERSQQKTARERRASDERLADFRANVRKRMTKYFGAKGPRTGRHPSG